jgi:hypothetical protein
VVTKTPKKATRWSTWAMAREAGLSQSSVSRNWRVFGLQQHRTETFKLSTHPYFGDKVHDVVGLYLDPPERVLVFCVDEKNQTQALDRSQSVLLMMPGVPQGLTHDCVRVGTTTLSTVLGVATDKVIGSLYRRHQAEEFKKLLIKPDPEVPQGPGVHLRRTTMPPTRPRPSRPGRWPIPASTCASPSPARPGSTWSGGGSPS